jgi:hypothetical protein
MRAVTQADGAGGAGNLFHRHGVREIAQSGTAVFLADRESQKSEFAGFAPQVSREFVAAVYFLRARRDALLRETAHLVADCVDHLA